MLQISLDGNEAESKRRRQLLWPHQSLPQSTPQHHDRLNLLYPNQRDDCCHKDDKSHRYVIGGETYPISVSTLIQRFFNHFDAREVSTIIINRYDIIHCSERKVLLRIEMKSQTTYCVLVFTTWHNT